MTERRDAFDPAELDPAVAALLRDQEEKSRIRTASKKDAARLRQQREKEEAERARQRARHRVTLELNQIVVDALRQVAQAEEISPASACNWLLANALLQYGRRDLDFAGCKKGTTSPRWPFTVDLETVAGDLEELLETGF